MGVDDTHFGVGQKISRQDLCVMAYRTLNACDVEIPETTEEVEFRDKTEIADYARDAVAALQKAGVINGDDDRHFNPQQTATRAEAAKIIYGVIGLTERN